MSEDKNEYSLLDLMNDEESVFESLREAKEETKKSKQALSSAATDFNKKYESEIQEGTLKRQLMLEQAGVADNTPEAEQVFKNNNEFMPTVQTPILNFLHFLTMEYKDIVENVDHLKQKYDEQYGHLEHLDYELGKSEAQVEAPHMEDYIYKNMDAGTFGKLKKLKALSFSSNEQEAHAAWQKCMELCEKFGISFDNIPCKLD